MYKGDTWEGWKVKKVESGKVLLTAGKQRAEIPLIGNFEAPKPNKQLLATQQRREHRRRQQALRIQRQQQQLKQQQLQQQTNSQQPSQNGAVNSGSLTESQQIQAAKAQLEQALKVGGNTQDGQPAAPVLSIKEALEARQRLMASRWGNKKSN